MAEADGSEFEVSRPTQTLGSVNRALDVLEAFSAATPEWRLSELARHLRVERPTLHRLLKTLVERGYLRQDPKSKAYRLGFALLRISDAVLADTPSQLALPHLRSLALKLGEQATLWALDGTDVVCLAKVAGHQPLQTHTQLGARQPATEMSSGRCLLAFAPDAPFGKLTLAGTVEARLERIRETGYDVNRGERWEDVTAVAAPVRDRTGRAVLAITVSGATTRFTDSRIDHAIEEVVASAAAISADLGG